MSILNTLRHVPRAAGLRRLSRLYLGLLLGFAAQLALSGCEGETQGAEVEIAGANAKHGISLIEQYGCGSCHVIPGIAGADGFVGPPLTKIGRRIFIAGVRRNTVSNMTAWLENPQAIVPGNAMPNMHIGERDARDVAAYLYTLR